MSRIPAWCLIYQRRKNGEGERLMSAAPKNQPDQPGDRDQSRRLLRSFAAYLRRIERELELLRDELSETGYAPEMFRALMRRYQDLSEEFQDYRENGRSKYYEALQRSEERLNLAEQIEEHAGGLAGQFEQYARSPDSFSWTRTRNLLKKVSVSVSNLVNACEDAVEGMN